MILKTSKSMRISIYIAGDANVARQVCQKWCFDVGACVTVEDVDFIYTGGAETGVRVGFINYPRFPRDEDDLMKRATDLGLRLMDSLFQTSFSIEGPNDTVWFSRRKEGEEE